MFEGAERWLVGLEKYQNSSACCPRKFSAQKWLDDVSCPIVIETLHGIGDSNEVYDILDVEKRPFRSVKVQEF